MPVSGERRQRDQGGSFGGCSVIVRCLRESPFSWTIPASAVSPRVSRLTGRTPHARPRSPRAPPAVSSQPQARPDHADGWRGAVVRCRTDTHSRSWLVAPDGERDGYERAATAALIAGAKI